MSNPDKELILLNSREASKFLRPNSKSDFLKTSRSKNSLWQNPPPKFLKIGNNVFYKKSTLIEWMDQFQEYQTLAEALTADELTTNAKSLTANEYSTNAESLTMNELTELI